MAAAAFEAARMLDASLALADEAAKALVQRAAASLAAQPHPQRRRRLPRLPQP